MRGKTYLTSEGLKKLQDELRDLKEKKRREIGERIKEARELGDLSENAEYQQAKEEQGFMETRIAELEETLKNVMVIAHHESDVVAVGSTITVEADGKEHTYTIVGSNEVDPSKGMISNESPLGQAFLGHKARDQVKVVIPKGPTVFTIKKIA
ncbi:MAG: transcription elongation factor GreA [bacterium]